MGRPDERLWHGGAPGLQPGDLLLPPAQTGIATSSDILIALTGFDPHDNGVETDRMRTDRVYLTRDRELARAYAACWTAKAEHGLQVGRGALYVARPIGEVWPDPDLPDVSVECERAEVIAVYDAAVTLPWQKAERRLLAHVGSAR
ncbi:hypothetical protein FLW53_23290 [Microbispora sp. SCL1-1]|uniref:hypothetical protein n=1 Tax=unclassified Microbispora TaxID=2614687 RepID=UPI0011595079|nr:MULTISPECIES: hypothetical protein [unclassified Microbispora]NJP27068.1 hypothetical protein [Microbispora sp. CL1-1]TQS11416.1 hypothetical protein FLW53_23290 [Microbispora sp. SCL1-1]